MALAFTEIAHAYETTPALSNVSFTAERGLITCLLGPSGCGKTTLLNLAAGILSIQSGEITLDGAVLASMGNCPPPEKRPVGLVFQDGALFPHMTVGQNVAFGRKQAQPAEIESLLDQVGLSGYSDRMPSQLSGGQQQRVALIRALATRPSVVLLDEPFANIDNQLRRAIREDTRAMLKASNAVAIMVTHDPEEAIEIADGLVILEAGTIAQLGTPEQVYRAPNSVPVAAMFGNGQVLSAQVSEAGVTTPFGVWPTECLNAVLPLSGAVDLVVRPDALSLTSGDLLVMDRRVIGPLQRVIVMAPDGSRLVCHQPTGGGLHDSDRAGLVPAQGSVFAYPSVE